ncbi:hypothetical protein LSCM1_05324 [Leishmania martiniquensis]|uniref:DNA (cytosine-5-)-methyltransferase n=1 Tax=Leishmania martiniquensis TaxID=1580590 RepID=A0A836KNF7_9TRYP|nr:hypothetical protein LSCM1_05324 [Leishmania martiniquensis]
MLFRGAASAMSSRMPYPTSYPAGVFVVRSKQQLAPLVARLRVARRLKTGRNVTVFDGEHFAVAMDSLESRQQASAPEADGSDTASRSENRWSSADADTAFGLRETPVHLYETTEAEAAELEMVARGGKRRRCSASDGIAAPLLTSLSTSKAHATGTRAADSAAACERCTLITAHDSVAGDELLALLRVPRAERAGSRWPPYMAAHVVSVFSAVELRTLLSPNEPVDGPGTATDCARGRELMGSSAAVAYIQGVRRFHRVCCPALGEIPCALAAMRRTALLQRHHHHHPTPCDEGVAGSTCASPSPPEGAAPLSATPLQRSGAAPAGRSQSTDSVSAPLFTFSELFGGIGMFRSGLEHVGGHAAFAVESAPPAQIVYALNHRCLHDCQEALQLPNEKRTYRTEGTADSLTHGSRDRSVTGVTGAASAGAEHHAAAVGDFSDHTGCTLPFLVGDITEIPSAFFPTHDVLTGGFPCQSFAKAGSAAGLYANVGWLFYEVVRVLASTRPTAFLLENVEHLVEVEAGAQLAEILARLRHPTPASSSPASRNAAAEYHVRYAVVDGGALTPQTRKRAYFFGFRVASALAAAPTVPPEHPPCQFVLPCADNGEAGAAAARVVADALQRIKTASFDSPYRTVQELLAAPSTADAPRSALQECSLEDEPNSTSSKVTSGGRSSAYENLRLTPAQWEAVRRSRTYRQNPMWRVCDVHGRARTLLGSYRTSYQLYSEFVLFSPERTLPEAMALLQQDDGSDDGARGSNAEGSASSASPPPPLRFFSLRECARLQGIEDNFLLPHDTTQLPSSADGAAVPAEVLRQVPIGAVYRLIGNAVNPRVVACLGGAIASYLRERRR